MSAFAREIGNLRRKPVRRCTKSELLFKLQIEWVCFKGGIENNLAGVLNEIGKPEPMKARKK